MPIPSATNQDGIEQALRLAIHHHAGQRDKRGECYMLHLLRVMMACSSPKAMLVAVLHDVLEDTSATEDDLVRAGMAPDVVEAIVLLTKPSDMRYQDYIVRLSTNPLAQQVKISDIHDNYRLDRVAYRREHTQEDCERIQRYILAYDFLTGGISRHEFLGRMASLD
jgi:(p)ppGpp synthase/HD superfamily hydrolase